MKAIKCTLIFHGTCKEINMGTFASISAAKRFVKHGLWVRPYTIKPLKH